MAGDITQSRCCCSTRNPRIGSGFSDKHEDPVQLADEDNIAVVEEEGGVPSVTLVGVHTGSFASFNGGRIIPNSVCAPDTLA